MKDKNDVIDEFNSLVNMTAAQLEKWLKSGDSKAAGWPKEDDGGESVGHDSGRKIVQILKDNPQRSPDKYTDDQIQHMRKVVSYCKRHLAQEGKINDAKSVEEVKKTKSYASLMNWGHDPLKEREGDEDEDDEEDVGTKRGSKDNQNGDNKRQKTGKSTCKEQEAGNNGATRSTNKQDKTDDTETKDDDAQQSGSGEDDNAKETNKSKKGDKKGSSGEAPDGKEPKKGDTVSWNWGQSQPEGTVKEVKHEKASITTKNGNTVSRDGTSEDPAVVIDAGQSKAIKLNHELN